jgi:hypothetical protein
MCKTRAFQRGIEHEIPLGIYWFTSTSIFHRMVQNWPKFEESKILFSKIKIWNIFYILALPECYSKIYILGKYIRHKLRKTKNSRLSTILEKSL